MKTLEPHKEEFKTQSYTLFPRVFSKKWVADAREAFDDIADRIPEVKETHKMGGEIILEERPDITLSAISVPRLLDFAELLVGPYVQLESVTYRAIPPVSESHAKERPRGYHRDMFAFFPEDGIYHRPLLFNAIVYLQDLTDESGPLYVIPGSHMRAMGMEQEARFERHPDELAVYPKAGDVVMFHCSLLHSGAPNITSDKRYIFIITDNLAWLKHRADYKGPTCQRIIEKAQVRGDRRLPRLLGVDDLMFRSANYGYSRTDGEIWEEWTAEDRAALKD